jgi:GNAT superfamily N-acetyltransferase
VSRVVGLTLADKPWVIRIWKHYEHILGTDPGVIWWRAWNPLPKNARWIGIPELAFAHYLTRQRDGVKVLYEVAVDPAAKRQGLGKELLAAIGYPMELKTNADSAESNSFYQRLGFSLAGQKTSTDGTRLFNIYRRL